MKTKQPGREKRYKTFCKKHGSFKFPINELPKECPECKQPEIVENILKPVIRPYTKDFKGGEEITITEALSRINSLLQSQADKTRREVLREVEEKKEALEGDIYGCLSRVKN
jgi:hypothetical protein